MISFMVTEYWLTHWNMRSSASLCTRLWLQHEERKTPFYIESPLRERKILQWFSILSIQTRVLIMLLLEAESTFLGLLQFYRRLLKPIIHFALLGQRKRWNHRCCIWAAGWEQKEAADSQRRSRGSGKRLKEEKKQELQQQKSEEEIQREETFKTWLSGLQRRRKVSWRITHVGNSNHI